MAFKFSNIAIIFMFAWSVTFLVTLVLHANIPQPANSQLLHKVIKKVPTTAKSDAVVVASHQSSSISLPKHPPKKQANEQPLVPIIDNPPSRRFPVIGTPEFADKCKWAVQDLVPADPPCIFYATTSPKDNEGISAWTSQIVMEFIYARQAGCQILFDYGKGVDIQQVLQPWPRLGQDAVNQLNNWTIPDPNTFRCREGCSSSRLTATIKHQTVVGRMKQYHTFAEVPNYRFVYFGNDAGLYRKEFQNLTLALKDYDLEIGMACSLGTLFHLSPQATQFEPQLFSNILPKLHNEHNLVISIYIRTGVTDNLIKNKTMPDEQLIGQAKRFIELCALPNEQEYLSGSAIEEDLKGTTFSRVIWMLVTDSPVVKTWTIANYNGSEVHINGGKTTTVVPREVVTTSSRGAHTKPKMDPSLADFAEAFIDWYLIGESDFVISHGGASFSTTGSLRTARPIHFHVNKECGRHGSFIKEGDPPIQ